MRVAYFLLLGSRFKFLLFFLNWESVGCRWGKEYTVKCYLDELRVSQVERGLETEQKKEGYKQESGRY